MILRTILILIFVAIMWLIGGFDDADVRRTDYEGQELYPGLKAWND